MLNFNPERTVKLGRRRGINRMSALGASPYLLGGGDDEGGEGMSVVGTVDSQSSGGPSGPNNPSDSTASAALRLDDTHLRRNQRSIEAHIDDDHYIRGFTPGEFALDAAGITIINVTAAMPRWSALSFADAVFSRATVVWRKPTQWRSGRIGLRFWYTSPVGSINNFFLTLRIMAIRGGEVLPGTDLLSLIGTTYPGPAVANTVIATSQVFTTVSLGSDDELFSLQISRDGGNASDTNVNALHVIYAEIEHFPQFQELT